MPENVLESLIVDIKEIGAGIASTRIAELGRSIERTGKEADKASRKHGGLKQAVGGVKGIAATTAGVVGAQGLAGGFAESIKNAEAFQAVQARLGRSIHNNVRKPAQDAVPHLSEVADHLSVEGGFAAPENIAGLARLVTATGSVAKSERDLELATNLARGQHVGLEKAVKAVTMVENGRFTGLSKMGIAVTKVTAAQDKLRDSHVKATSAQRNAAKEADLAATKERALETLHRRFAGQAETYGKTAAGAMNNFRNATEVLSTRLGTLLLPAITSVFGALSKFVDGMMTGKGAGGDFVGVLKQVWQVLTQVWKVLQPVFVVLKNIAVLLAGAVIGVFRILITILRTEIGLWATFGNVAAAAFRGMLSVARTVINWIGSHWRILVVGLLGPFGVAIVLIVNHWNTLRKVVGSVIGFIIGAVKSAVGVISTVWGTLTGILSKPFTWLWEKVVQPAIKWITAGITGMVHAISGLISSLLGPLGGLVSKVADLASKLLSLPGKILGKLQGGGTVIQGGMFLVGEAGPELVHLPAGSKVVPNHQLRHGSAAPSGGDAVSGGREQTIVIYNILDGKQVSRSVVRQGLLQQSRM